MNSKKILNNASWIVGCRVVQSLVAFVIGMITARYLGPANYGLISYAASIVAFLLPVAQLGLRNTLVDEIISHPDREGETIGTAIAVTSISAIFSACGAIAFVALTNSTDKTTVMVCALYSIGILFQMAEMLQYWFQAKLLSRYTAITSLIAYIIVSAYKVYLLFSGKNIYWFAVSSALDSLFISVSLAIIYRKLSIQRLTFSLRRAKAMLSQSKYYIVSGLMVSLFSQTDRIMIKLISGDEANGYYSAAVTCAGIAGFVFQAIIDSFRPQILESKEDEEAFNTNFICLYSVVIYFGVLLSAVFTIFAEPIVGILYEKEYALTVDILRIITWYSAFSYLGAVRNVWILAKNKQKYLWIINLSGAVLNIAGNAILIPFFGAVGASIATVITQLFTNLILCFIIRPIRPVGYLILNALNPVNTISFIGKINSKRDNAGL